MGLTRKKVRVRTKSGKVYQRSMLVKAETKKLNKGGKLNALNPWEQRHMEHVSTNSALGERARAYGSSGPGSDHSLFASLIGAHKQRASVAHQNSELFRRMEAGQIRDSRALARQRVLTGAHMAAVVDRALGAGGVLFDPPSRRIAAKDRVQNLAAAFGVDNVEHVPPRRTW